MKIRLLSIALWAWLLSGCNSSTSTDSSATEIVVRNRTYSTYTAIYITSCSNSSWGRNRLYSDMPPGTNREFPVDPGCYDVRGETPDRYVEFNAIEVTSGATYTLTITN